jgi:putative hydrolase of the HAD superfamily
MIEAVVFDFGGTLIEYAGEKSSLPDLEIPGMHAAHATLQREGVLVPDLTLFQGIGFELLPNRWQQAMAGTQNLTLDGLLAAILEVAGSPIPDSLVLHKAARQYEAALCGKAVPIPYGRELLEQLKAEGYRLGLLSNTMFAGASHIGDLERFGLAGYFEAMLFSADAQKWKPNPAAFHHVLELLQVAPKNAVYIGDDPAADIMGGRAAGMKTIHFPSTQRMVPPNGTRPDATIEHLWELPGHLVALGRA